jgi:hypothetical protein
LSGCQNEVLQNSSHVLCDVKHPLSPHGGLAVYSPLPTWKQVVIGFVQNVLQDSIDHLRLLADHSQLNRRTRIALKRGRAMRASYLAVQHHQRRLARRREIRRLVEGPVSVNQ